MKYLRRGCLLLLVVVVSFATGYLIYGLTRPSALGHLAHLAHIERTTDLTSVQAALLHQLPVGTPISSIERFLRAADVNVDLEQMLQSRNSVSASRFENTYVHCYSTEFAYGITCLLLDDPDRLTFPCRNAIAIAFELDGDDKLKTITVQDKSRCL